MATGHHHEAALPAAGGGQRLIEQAQLPYSTDKVACHRRILPPCFRRGVTAHFAPYLPVTTKTTQQVVRPRAAYIGRPATYLRRG